MIAEIIVKKARKKGIDGFILVEFKNILSYKDLPDEYFKGEVFFYTYFGDYLFVWTDKVTERIYPVGSFISKEKFNRLILTLKQAGQKLADINKRNKNYIRQKEITIKI